MMLYAVSDSQNCFNAPIIRKVFKRSIFARKGEIETFGQRDEGGGLVLALRCELDKVVILVREALEHTKAHGIRFKRPKSKAGRRDVTLLDILVSRKAAG